MHISTTIKPTEFIGKARMYLDLKITGFLVELGIHATSGQPFKNS